MTQELTPAIEKALADLRSAIAQALATSTSDTNTLPSSAVTPPAMGVELPNLSTSAGAPPINPGFAAPSMPVADNHLDEPFVPSASPVDTPVNQPISPAGGDSQGFNLSGIELPASSPITTPMTSNEPAPVIEQVTIPSSMSAPVEPPLPTPVGQSIEMPMDPAISAPTQPPLATDLPQPSMPEASVAAPVGGLSKANGLLSNVLQKRGEER